MPNLVGKTADEAESLLAQAGLKGSAQQKENDAEAGTVFQQDTNTGVKVPEGSTITYWVFHRPLHRHSSRRARQIRGRGHQTSNAGFTVVSEPGDYSDTYAAGTVMAQSATGEAKAGSSITITISKGSNPNIEVPDVTGKAEAEAKSAMPSGVHVEVKYEASSTVGKGLVIRQSASGPVKKGATVTLTVSSGAADGGSDTGGESLDDEASTTRRCTRAHAPTRALRAAARTNDSIRPGRLAPPRKTPGSSTGSQTQGTQVEESHMQIGPADA